MSGPGLRQQLNEPRDLMRVPLPDQTRERMKRFRMRTPAQAAQTFAWLIRPWAALRRPVAVKAVSQT